MLYVFFFFFFFKQKTAYEMLRSLVGSEMCIRDRYQRRVRGTTKGPMAMKACVPSTRCCAPPEHKNPLPHPMGLEDIGSPAVCPITHELMFDPVRCADGFIYERAAIQQWLCRCSRSPLTNEPLTHLELSPDIALRTIIVRHRAAVRIQATFRRWRIHRDFQVKRAATRGSEVQQLAPRLPRNLRANVSAGMRMVRDTAAMRYTPSQWSAVVAMSAALAYLVSPIDAIPDGVPFVGLLDDAAVLCAVIGGVAAVELARYQAWAAQRRLIAS
eukprot:TRINITY_DN1582_c0_g1_i1.p1 TRINITY_DN1582_c0_g1~~TRINITY_DN1582_c0_g1_i1.p1  ORF type:complete len:271 (-),score=50.53 TRINITY_DN1582_c0_g1_i1:284-1096(-)